MTGMICEDLIVLECGAGSVAASILGMFLADNGARVIKVEPPEGDRLREVSPAGWLVWNRGKESLVADLRTPEGREEVRRLSAQVDVLIEGFGADRAAAWEMDYPDLRDANPSLIYCSIKGFGPSGPYAKLKGYDAIVCAKAGVFGRGDFSFRPGPIFNGGLLASNGAAQMALGGLMAALVVRDATGEGQRVDATLWQGLNPLDYFFSYHLQLGQKAAEKAERAGESPQIPQSASGSAATRYGVTACTRDGRWLSFSPQMAHQAQALVRVLGLEEMLDDPRFAKMPEFPTLEDAEEWDRRIWERLKEEDVDVWVQRGLADDDLPFDRVLSAEEALDHPQLRHNGNVITVEDPDFGEIEQVGPVGAFEKTPSVARKSAPRLGDHDAATLVGRSPSAVPMGTGSTDPPLSGVTIVEFGYFYAMPYGVSMAASFGARVIKVEALSGDPMRTAFGAAEWGSAKVTEGKESIALELRTPEGREIFHKLISQADVFVQGFRPGVDARLGADYKTLREIKPDLVYLHGSGYGSDGPYAHRAIYAGVAGALAGSIHRQAAYWFDTELAKSLSAEETQVVIAPRLRTASDGDANAALSVLSSLMLAVRHLRRTGEGQFVSTSMVGGNVLAYSDDFNRYTGKVPIPQADPDQLGLSATYRLYESIDGWCFLAATTDDEFRKVLGVMGRADLEKDERFSTAVQRTEYDDELATELAAIFATRHARDWESLLTEAGVGCVEVRNDGQAQMTCTDPVLRETGLVEEITHPLFGSLLRYGPPARLSASSTVAGSGCTFAQNTESILTELGYTSIEIEALAEKGAVSLGVR
jgi:crotonobetainyl-CoA:carnitine CoA-transferase CaiB-like acyl-CoA transferase